MGWLDQFEDWPPYRRLWESWPGRPWTHAARDVLGRWPGSLLWGAACFALGAWAAGGGPLWTLAAVVALALVAGHLWV